MNLTLLIFTLAIALIFEFTNGFHDAANVVSTVIATKVLRPLTAIILAATLNLLGATQTSKVATTITQGLIPSSETTQFLILAALLGAIFWNLLTWYYGVPSSSSYALIGGLLGAGIKSLGIKAILWSSLVSKVILPMLISPLLGFFISLYFMRLLFKTVSSHPSYAFFGRMQILSSSLVAIAHGFNDAQKTMAIMTLALYSAQQIPSLEIPMWVILICAITMGLGTAFGGFKIIDTIGFKITKLEPIQGFAAESTASVLICLASFLGFPLSSTHLIVGSVSGVGSAISIKNTSWTTAKKLIYAWIFTLPGAALASALIYMILGHLSIF